MAYQTMQQKWGNKFTDRKFCIYHKNGHMPQDEGMIYSSKGNKISKTFFKTTLEFTCCLGQRMQLQFILLNIFSSLRS